MMALGPTSAPDPAHLSASPGGRGEVSAPAAPERPHRADQVAAERISATAPLVEWADSPSPKPHAAAIDAARDKAVNAVSASPAQHQKNLTIEGPAGSFSILPARPPKANDPAPQADALSSGPEAIVADLRAFAADLVAEYRKDAAPTVTRPTPAPPAVELAPAPLEAPSRTQVSADRHRAVRLDSVHRDFANQESASQAPAGQAPAGQAPAGQHEPSLPLAAAPQLADMPHRTEPPRREVDITQDLFADVMALSEEERIALFT
jgi:hypothetical protein